MSTKHFVNAVLVGFIIEAAFFCTYWVGLRYGLEVIRKIGVIFHKPALIVMEIFNINWLHLNLKIFIISWILLAGLCTLLVALINEERG